FAVVVGHALAAIAALDVVGALVADRRDPPADPVPRGILRLHGLVGDAKAGAVPGVAVAVLRVQAALIRPVARLTGDTDAAVLHVAAQTLVPAAVGVAGAARNADVLVGVAALEGLAVVVFLA